MFNVKKFDLLSHLQFYFINVLELHFFGQSLLFANFTDEYFEEFKSKYNEVAEIYKGKDIGFLMGDLDISQGAFQVMNSKIIGLYFFMFCILCTCKLRFGFNFCVISILVLRKTRHLLLWFRPLIVRNI